MAARRFSHARRVTYAECTLGNHVYYARYLNLLEEARGEFFRSLGIPMLSWQEKDTAFPVIECHLKYKSPARYDDLLNIEVWLAELERVRLNFAYRIVNQTGQLILEGQTFHVCVSLKEKPKRIPAELDEILRPYLNFTATDDSTSIG